MDEGRCAMPRRKKAKPKAPEKKARRKSARGAQTKRSPTPQPQAEQPPMEELMSMDQAIELLKTTRSTFYRWLRSGKVKGMKAGRQWRFQRSDIERFMKGEEPRIELRADIGPLITQLSARLREIAGKRPDVKTIAGEAPAESGGKVLHAVSLMIRLGVKMGASDIHIAPHLNDPAGDHTAVLRYRVDGVLHEAAEFDIRLLPAVVERWKIMADCDTHEKGKPQDGRIVVKIEGKTLDLRVCILPAVMGESVTARILDRETVILSLDRIDFAPHDRERLLEAVEAPWGLVVFSGPTGSGKTTVMYACLNHVSKPALKLMSVENPVEYFLPWVVQVGIRPAAGLTFPVALRSVLRSDPDIVMVGELRDYESLAVTMQTSLTGHLVLTSLHADEAPRALKRMAEMGMDPFVVADATKLIVAQRLVRKLCPYCSEKEEPPANLLDAAAEMCRDGGINFHSLPKKYAKPVGCAKCGMTGFKSRTIIAETLKVSPEIGAALRRGASVEELRHVAVGQGMTTMAADGVRRAANGETALREVIRVLGLR